MSQKISRRLWCLLEGDPEPYEVSDISIAANVNDLKAVIKRRIKRLKDIDTKGLKLLKLNEGVPISPHDSLTERLAALGNIATCSKRLSPDEEVGELFPEPPSQKHLHIVVQILAPFDSESLRLKSLNCVVNGDTRDRIFTVEIHPSKTVAALKKAIKEEQKPALDYIPHTALDLCNVSIPVDDRFEENVEMVDENLLLPLNKLSKVFCEPLDPEHVHIIVKVPAVASRKRLQGEEDGQEAKRQKIQPDVDLPWLMELHSKIWEGGDDCLKKFVHKVKVTMAHYRELQQRLSDPHLNRNSDEDILAIKRDILLHYKPNHNTTDNPANVSEESDNDDPELEPNSNTPGNEQVPANVDEESDDDDPEVDEESDDDDPELDSLLPYNFEFLDLSSLELKNMPSRLPVPLFIRPEYSFILEKIQGNISGTRNSQIVSGQPGIGKTAFLYYMMIKYMLDGIPFLYQSMYGTVYHVSEQVEIITSWHPSKNIVAFVDTDETESQENTPKWFLHHRCVQFILASSSTGAPPKWIEQIGFVIRLIMELWTPREFFVTGIFLHPYHLDFARLMESASYFGFNPRRCFNASTSQRNLEDCLLEVTNAICSIDKSVPLFQLLEETVRSKHIYHFIFELFPLNEDRYLEQAQVRSVSQWALGQLLEQYIKRQANAAADFYKQIADVPGAGLLCGQDPL